MPTLKSLCSNPWLLFSFAAASCLPSLLFPGAPPEGSSLDILAAASELLHLSGKDASPPTAKLPQPQGRDHAATAAAAGGSQPRRSDLSGLTGPAGNIPGGTQPLDLLMKPDGDMGATPQLVQGPGGAQHLVLVQRQGGGGGPAAAGGRGVPSAQPLDAALDLDALPPELRRQLLRMGAGGPGQPQLLSLGGMVGPGQVPGGAGLAVGAGGRSGAVGMAAMDGMGGAMQGGGGGGAGRSLPGGGGPTPSDAVLRQLIQAAATQNQVRRGVACRPSWTPGLQRCPQAAVHGRVRAASFQAAHFCSCART